MKANCCFASFVLLSCGGATTSPSQGLDAHDGGLGQLDAGVSQVDSGLPDAGAVVGNLFRGRTPAECKSQPDQGSCSDNIQRYYYDAVADDCLAFAYSGCGGDANNFLTLTGCFTFCRSAIECSCPSGAIGCSTANGCAACPPGDSNYASGTACSSPGLWCFSGLPCVCSGGDGGTSVWSCTVSL